MKRTILHTILYMLVLSASSGAYAKTCAAKSIVLEQISRPASVYDTSFPTPHIPYAEIPENQKAVDYRRLGINLYQLPYSRTLSIPNWGRLWANTAVLMAGGVTTMLILEALLEDATAWNKAANNRVPLFKRYVNHLKAGPVWDGDKFIFNYILHPYAGAAYYMSARSCGFNCFGSFMYSFCISTFFWEYGFEAFNEIPSVQDLVITPVVGSVMGECFYKLKRHIVSEGYRLWGSPILGYFVAFICDPVNETLGYFRGDQKRAKRFAKQNNTTDFAGGFSIAPGKHGIETMLTVSIRF